MILQVKRGVTQALVGPWPLLVTRGCGCHSERAIYRSGFCCKSQHEDRWLCSPDFFSIRERRIGCLIWSPLNPDQIREGTFSPCPEGQHGGEPTTVLFPAPSVPVPSTEGLGTILFLVHCRHLLGSPSGAQDLGCSSPLFSHNTHSPWLPTGHVLLFALSLLSPSTRRIPFLRRMLCQGCLARGCLSPRRLPGHHRHGGGASRPPCPLYQMTRALLACSFQDRTVS